MRYVVPESFRMPVTIRVATRSGADVVRTLWVDQREDTLVVDGVSAPPTMVVFDAANQILKTLTFEQPTQQLATQLQNDQNLWNRWWVIQQLAKRTDDSAAAAALANAAERSDYFLTRQQASSALARFPAGLATPALARAVRDTSSQVRQAAVGALGQIGGTDALALARSAWQQDTSYEVRAAALSALVRLDTANRRALITEGLRTPSYRDAIQDAAIGAAVRTGDTSFASVMQSMIGEQQLPAYALAAMVIRGNPQALSLLVSDLNDARPYVRRWALAAIVQSLGPTRGLPALKNIQQTLTYADTRADVARAVKRLEDQAKAAGGGPGR
jgi:HEAT repeat protein